MADLHKQFQTFNQELNVTGSKLNKLKRSFRALRDTVRAYFSEHHPELTPKFYTQGSYQMGTMIRTKEDTCDLDDGVYFTPQPKVTAPTLQKWVKDAVDGVTKSPVQHRNKCIRVTYAGDYEIDLPVYYQTKANAIPHLAVKDNGYQENDPKAFISWFNGKKSAQMVRIVRYLKAWGDNVRHTMPAGIVFSVLVANNYVAKDSDDESLLATLKAIRAKLRSSFVCTMPTTPFDDLLAKFDYTKRNNFFDRLDNFIGDATDAINQKSKEKAANLWRKHLGDRFPECDDKSEALTEAAKLILSGKAVTTPDGRLSSVGIDSGFRHTHQTKFHHDV